MKLKLATLAVAAALSGAAQAQIVVPWGNHDVGELGGTLFFGTGSSFAFDVVYTFSLSNTVNALAVGVTNDAPGLFDINGAKAELYASNGNANFSDDTLLGSFTFDSTAVTHTFSPLVAGNYFYRVTGHVDGPLGGSYLLSSHIDAVPEPETYAMFLAGLGLMGAIARRRTLA